MKKFVQSLLVLLIVATIGISLAPAGTISQPFSTRPYVYDSVFPAARLNTDFQYTLDYTDAAIAGPMAGNAATATYATSAGTASSILPTWTVVTTSSVAANGAYLAVDTSTAAVSTSLPASGVANRVSILDATNSFATHNLTIVSASGVNLNGVTGSPASEVIATSGVMVDCYYLNTAIGYRCIVQ